MIQSTKPERKAIEARLKEALLDFNDSSLEATLNALQHFDAVEEMFLKLHARYEKLFITEGHSLMINSGVTKEEYHNEMRHFLYEFNKMADLFSTHYLVQRRKSTTDSVLRNLSSDLILDRKTGELSKKSPVRKKNVRTIPMNNSASACIPLTTPIPPTTPMPPATIDCALCKLRALPISPGGNICVNCSSKHSTNNSVLIGVKKADDVMKPTLKTDSNLKINLSDIMKNMIRRRS